MGIAESCDLFQHRMNAAELFSALIWIVRMQSFEAVNEFETFEDIDRTTA